jgi:DNA-binding NtrC family response regulator
MSGMEVLEHIKAFDPDIEVIVVTGYSSLDSALRGLRFGVFDYVSKPFDVRRSRSWYAAPSRAGAKRCAAGG